MDLRKVGMVVLTHFLGYREVPPPVHFLMCILCIYVCAPECRLPRGPEVSDSPGAGITGICVMPNLETGN